MSTSRGRHASDGWLQADARRLLGAYGRVLDDQPLALSRRFGIVNLSWIAVEELGATRGPDALEALLNAGYLRRHPRDPEIGRVTPTGSRLLASAPVAA